MTVEAFSSLPLAAGSAVATAAGRAALLAISAYMRAPLRNTAIAGLVGLSAMAGSNALYKQSHHHPAPLFGSFETPAAPAKSTPTKQVVPADRPAKLSKTAAETTGSINPDKLPAANQPIGNTEVFEVQRKLQSFGFFDGKVDGYYGPRTARAIKAFEAKLGRTPTGMLTPDIIKLIDSTPIFAEPQAEAAPLTLAPAPEAIATPEATSLPEINLPSVTPQPGVDPAALPALTVQSEATPLPAPAPLAPLAAAAEQPSAAAPLALTTPTADAEAPSAAAAATEAVTTVVKRVVPTITVRAIATGAIQPAPAATDTVQTMPAALDTPAALAPPAESTNVATDKRTVTAVQRGLASLGFLHTKIDGVAGETTAKAIRNFEVYFNYDVTGRITPELVNLLVSNGAQI